jgi:hypothetical protein
MCSLAMLIIDEVAEEQQADRHPKTERPNAQCQSRIRWRCSESTLSEYQIKCGVCRTVSSQHVGIRPSLCLGEFLGVGDGG